MLLMINNSISEGNVSTSGIHNMKQTAHKGLVLFEDTAIYDLNLAHHLSLLALNIQVKSEHLSYHGLGLVRKNSLDQLCMVIESRSFYHQSLIFLV